MALKALLALLFISTHFVESHETHKHIRTLSGKQRCGYEEPSEEEQRIIQKEIDEYRRSEHILERSRTDEINIDVYFHVFLDSSGKEGKVTDEQIAKQMEILNNSFSGIISGTSSSYPECCGCRRKFKYGDTVNTPFRFTLVDTVRVFNDTLFNLDGEESKSIRKSLRKGTCSDLYVFTGQSKFLGSANTAFRCPDGDDPNIPEDHDMIVLNYETLPEGGMNLFEEGDTFVHETGHWLGLRHPFEGGCSAVNDAVSDTPAQFDASYGCEIGRDTCASEGVDPVHNFMGYSDDCCMYRFTEGQVELMTLQYWLYRDLKVKSDPPSSEPTTSLEPSASSSPSLLPSSFSPHFISNSPSVISKIDSFFKDNFHRGGCFFLNEELLSIWNVVQKTLRGLEM